ncbi:hypothetical protein TB1_023495 [Malus domestica]
MYGPSGEELEELTRVQTRNAARRARFVGIDAAVNGEGESSHLQPSSPHPFSLKSKTVETRKEGKRSISILGPTS